MWRAVRASVAPQNPGWEPPQNQTSRSQAKPPRSCLAQAEARGQETGRAAEFAVGQSSGLGPLASGRRCADASLLARGLLRRRPSVSSCLSAPDRSRELGSSQACGLGSLFSFLHLCLPRSLHLLAAFPAAPSSSSPAFPRLRPLCSTPCGAEHITGPRWRFSMWCSREVTGLTKCHLPLV